MSSRYMVNKNSGEVFVLNPAWMSYEPEKWVEVADATGTPLQQAADDQELAEPAPKKPRGKKPSVADTIAETDAALSRDASVGL